MPEAGMEILVWIDTGPGGGILKQDDGVEGGTLDENSVCPTLVSCILEVFRQIGA